MKDTDKGELFSREVYELIEQGQDREVDPILMYAHLTVAAQGIRNTFDEDTARDVDSEILKIINNER